MSPALVVRLALSNGIGIDLETFKMHTVNQYLKLPD